MSLSVNDSIVSQYALQFQTAGNPEAAQSAARAVESALGLKLTTEQFDTLATRFVNTKPSDPTASLPEPRALQGAYGKPLSDADPVSVTTDIYSCMALFQQLAQGMRNAAREQRAVEGQAKFDAHMNAAKEMESAADDRFSAALTEGIFQIAGGAMQIGSSVMSARASMKSAGAMSADGAPTATSRAFDASAARWDGVGKGSSGILSGVGGSIAASVKQDADYHDAQGKKLEAQATAHDTAMQQANDVMQQALEVIRDVRDKLQAMEQASIETNKGIARNV